ncbi:MAG: thermitase [Solirubrobacteraceae bacterium]|nr:thermitase [Solirubrobacteraceae bacterium]
MFDSSAPRLIRRTCGVAATGLLLLASPALASDGARLLVRFRPGVSTGAAQRVLSAHGARQTAAVPRIGVAVVSVAGPAAGARDALAGDAAVQFAEPDAVATPQETVPDDPFFPQGSFAIGGGAWGWYRSHTTQAWDVTAGDPAVTIAILDTGLKPSALDFAGQLTAGWNVLANSSDTSSNAGNHGTYVAGVAGLAMNTATGNAGYCPKCRIMPVQVGTDTGAAYSDMASGIIWAADHGARVENLSWAGTTSSATLQSAVSYARSKGVVVFAAAGNANCDCPTYPSATPGVLGVGGVSSSGAKAGDSNYGSWVAVAAPEGNMTAWPAVNGSPGYAQVGGTSLAAPAAAGIAGLLFSAKPLLDGAQVEAALQSTATPASFALRYGEVDAMAALGALGFADPQLAVAPSNTIAPQILVQTNGDQNNAPLGGAPAVGQVLVRGQGAWQGSSPLVLGALRWNRCNADGTGCVVVGSSSKYTVASADSGYALRLVVTFSDPQGATSASSPLSAPVGATAAPAPPASTAPPAISGIAQAGQSLAASAGSWSGSPAAYAYQWSRCDAAGGGCGAIAGATAASLVLGSSDVGSTVRVAVTASNASGSATASSAASAVVQAPPPPPPSANQTLTFAGSLTPKASSQRFAVPAGAGPSHATLAFSKCSSLTLELTQGTTSIAKTSGASGLTLDRTLSAGDYGWVVSGSTRCSFTLTVTTATP